MNIQCPHHSAKIKNRLTRTPLYTNGKVVDERIIIRKTWVCPTCGPYKTGTYVSTARTENPLWRPKAKRKPKKK
jgi:hypothetical protein